jgi:histone acetyltransferase (RNA polymerase elongator complex component)
MSCPKNSYFRKLQHFIFMSKRHFTIPVFIPMAACPFHCIYCDQKTISGHAKLPDPNEVESIIEQYLSTIPWQESEVEAGFFGGTFTALPVHVQEQFLLAVQPFIESEKVKTIRLSTRPDFITRSILDLLKKYYVSTIELGAQSMDDETLMRSGRGHTAADTRKAAQLIVDNGFRLGLQMMIGLPGDTPEKSLFTARQFVKAGANDVRIYPTIVVKDTPLEKMFLAGKYLPLTLENAVDLTAGLIPVFEENGVNVIRVGLHPSEDLLNRESLVAGPFHVSFRELVNTRLWKEQLLSLNVAGCKNNIVIFVPEKELNWAIGYKASNRRMLGKRFKKVDFKTDKSLTDRNFYVDYH